MEDLYTGASLSNLQPAIFPPAEHQCRCDDHDIQNRCRLIIQEEPARQTDQPVVGESRIHEDRGQRTSLSLHFLTVGCAATIFR